MPVYEVTSPDGKKYRVNAPDGASQEDAIAYVKNNQPAAETSFGGVESRADTVSRQPERTAGDYAGLTGRSVARGVGGMADMARQALPYIPGMQLIGAADKLSGMDRIGARDVADAAATQAGAPMPRTPTERVASDVGEALTGTAMTAGLGAAAQVPFLGARPGLQALSAVTGAGAGGATREAGGGQGAQLLATLAGGMAVGQPLGKGARVSQHPEKQAITELSKELDIPLRPAAFGSGAVEFLRGQPFVGAKKNYTGDVAKFNKNLNKALGIDAPILTKKVYADKMDDLNRIKTDILERNALEIDQQLMDDIALIKEQAGVSGPDEAKIIQNIVEDQVAGRFKTEDGRMAGKSYKKLEETLAGAGGKAETHINDLKAALANAMERSMTPEDAAAFKKWRQEFGDIKSLETLVANGTDSYLNPNDLLKAYTTKEFNQKSRFVQGRRGEVGKFAELGQYIKAPATSIIARAPGAIPMGAALTTLMIQQPAIGAALLWLSHMAGRASESPRVTKFLAKPSKASTRKKSALAAALGTTQAVNANQNNSGGGR